VEGGAEVNPDHPLVVFVLGAPGAGKTTLVRELLKYYQQCFTVVTKPKWTLAGDACAAGHYTGGKFDGADTVPYNGARAAFDYWVEHGLGKRITFLDGDRFSNENAYNWFASTGADVRCIYLEASEQLLAARRAQRGSTQNKSWMKGRGTKAWRFAIRVGKCLTLDASLPLHDQLIVVRRYLAE
jgi:hypothetical protein